MNKVHRFISLLLCLALILFCLSSPLRRSASASGTVAIAVGGTAVNVLPAIAVIVVILVGVGLATDNIDYLVNEATDIYNNASSTVKSWLSEAGEALAAGKEAVKIPEIIRIEIDTDLARKQFEEPKRIPENMPYLLIPPSLLNLQNLSQSDVFAQDVVGAIEITNSRLLSLYGLLNTSFSEVEDYIYSQTSSISSGFLDLGSKISTLTNTLTSKLGSIETSLDVMTSTLSDDISDLKTVTSSFGNAILSKLDKLDAINTSIQNISFADLSADFVDLRETIALYDSNILKAVTAIPDQVSDTLSSYFDTLSNDLHDISQKLGAETSYLQDLLLEFQSIRDVITNGFADVLVSLDSISVEVDVPIDLQSVIDQIFSSEASIVGVLDSVYSVLDNGFLGLEDALLGYFESVNDLFLNEYLDIFANGISDAVGSLSDILSNTENLVEVKVSLEELVGSNLLTSDIFLGSDLLTGSFFENIIGDLSLTVWNRIQDLLDHLTTAHSNLSSRIGSINSNLAGKITDFKDALIGDFADFKSWLSDILPGILVGVNGIAGNTIDLDDSLLDALSDAEAPLYESILSGFDQGGNFFGLTTNFLVGEYDAFLAAAKIINEFTDLSFFDKLIVASASIGLVGALLGMALNAVNYSATQRRREEAAQAKASSRMERSCAA